MAWQCAPWCGSVHIIGEHQGTSDLPEHRHMKGVDGGYTGEKGVSLDQRARGMGGLQTSCGEENLLDLDSDPRYTHARTHARTLHLTQNTTGRHVKWSIDQQT